MSLRCRKVYNLLCNGKHTVTDITIKTGFGDPRSYIRDLREKGVNVLDEWRKTSDGVRYKVYYIQL